MQHVFEFVAKLADDKVVHMNYIGKTSRHSKVTEKILEDLKKVYNIERDQVVDLYLKPVKKK